MELPRVRFAPSPTGYLHVGGARTALFDFLFARHYGGTFILRIEDTDRGRYQAGACEEIYESLRWLGLDWDEGPGVGGDYGPYIQSERTALYREHAQQLIDTGHAYRCFCSSERLDEVRKQREKAKLATGYDRHCRDLPAGEINRLLDERTPHVVRLKVPGERTVSFTDLIRGPIEYRSEVLDDLVLLKSDGFPTYHLANVVDDHHMRISHVLRADEWIASTPRHVLLYEALGWELPHFAHLPVVLDPAGGKLSKRKGAASVMDYKRGGILPESLLNFLALMGWAPGDDREKMSRDELIEAFAIEKVSPKAAVFDEKKLEWLNGRYLQERTVESIAADVIAQWREKGVIDKSMPAGDPAVMTALGLLKDRSKRLTEIAESGVYFFSDPTGYEEKAARKHFRDGTAEALVALTEKIAALPRFNCASIENAFRDYAGQSGRSAGDLIHPARLAVSGVSFGPGLFELLEALGRETVIRRMRRAAEWIGAQPRHE